MRSESLTALSRHLLSKVTRVRNSGTSTGSGKNIGRFFTSREYSVTDSTSREYSVTDSTSREYTVTDSTSRGYIETESISREYIVTASTSREYSVTDSASREPPKVEVFYEVISLLEGFLLRVIDELACDEIFLVFLKYGNVHYVNLLEIIITKYIRTGIFQKLYQCGNENDYNVVNECMSENKNKGEI